MAEEVTEKMEDLSVEASAGGEAIYTSEKRGSDESGEGTYKVPYKTILQAMRRHGKEPFPVIYQDPKEDSEAAKSGQLYEVVAKSQLKKMTKLWQQEVRKASEKAKKEAEAMEAQAKRAEEAKKVKIEEDKSLPAAQKIHISEGAQSRGQRVKVYGWVHRLRRQGKALIFITLRDGTGFLQCVLNGDMCQTYDAIMLTTEATVCIYGTLAEVPEGKTAPGGHELNADFWQLIGSAPPGGADAILNEDSHPDVQLDNRHIMIRGENSSKVLPLHIIHDVLVYPFSSTGLKDEVSDNAVLPRSLLLTRLQRSDPSHASTNASGGRFDAFFSGLLWRAGLSDSIIATLFGDRDARSGRCLLLRTILQG